jgi:hypothetical protein
LLHLDGSIRQARPSGMNGAETGACIITAAAAF